MGFYSKKFIVTQTAKVTPAATDRGAESSHYDALRSPGPPRIFDEYYGDVLERSTSATTLEERTEAENHLAVHLLKGGRADPVDTPTLLQDMLAQEPERHQYIHHTRRTESMPRPDELRAPGSPAPPESFLRVMQDWESCPRLTDSNPSMMVNIGSPTKYEINNKEDPFLADSMRPFNTFCEYCKCGHGGDGIQFSSKYDSKSGPGEVSGHSGSVGSYLSGKHRGPDGEKQEPEPSRNQSEDGHHLVSKASWQA